MIRKLNQFISQNKFSISSFLTVGVLTAIVYFSLFNFFWKILEINYHIALSIAYVIAITFYFFVNRSVTFKNNDRHIGQQIAKFSIMIIFNYMITLAVVHGAVEIANLQPSTGMILAIITTTISNYFVAKTWIFKHIKSESS